MEQARGLAKAGQVMVLIAGLAATRCTSSARTEPGEPAKTLLARVAKAQEDYALLEFYALSRRFLKLHPKHPEVDRIRYELAAQLIAENLKAPRSPQANEARALLRQAKAAAQTEDRRFEAALMLLKFDGQGEPTARAEAMLRDFQGHPDLRQVYFWVIDQLIARKKLSDAARYSARLLEQAPDDPQLDRYRAIVRRAQAAQGRFPWPEGFSAPAKLTLVDFWASWCAPCIAAIPELAALKARFGEALLIVGVNMDEQARAMRPFEGTMPWPHLRDAEHKLSDKLGIEALPAYVLVDPQGKILSMELERKDLAQAITKALSKR